MRLPALTLLARLAGAAARLAVALFPAAALTHGGGSRGFAHDKRFSAGLFNHHDGGALDLLLGLGLRLFFWLELQYIGQRGAGFRPAAGDCGHIKGHEYDGKLCWGELTGLTDVYEWSFVAVPAQPEAGVLQKSKAAGVLRKALAGQDQPIEALEQLEREAGLGRRYLERLRKEVARLGGLAWTGLDAAALRPMVDRLEEPQLLELKKAYQARVAQRFPVEVQLTYRGERLDDARQDGAFLI